MVKIILVSKMSFQEETNYKHNDADKLYKSAGFKNNSLNVVKWKELIINTFLSSL